MKENNLLASVALFSELYNNENYNNITDILGEFIKGAVVTENKWTVNSTELTHLLEKVYDFKIPEAVVRTTVKNRLKGVLTKIENGFYFFDNKIKEDFGKIDDEYNSIILKQEEITKELLKFIESKEKVILTDEDKATVIENLNKYLLDNGVTDKYSKYISAFVIKNQGNMPFTESLNLIREGIILYQGIKYTADINELGKWSTELTIFLSTEHLFSALGFNGILFQQIFNDFYDLVNEINISGKNKDGEKLIQLKYFEETKAEFDLFFQVAEQIQKGNIALDSSRPAMKAILEGCKYPSDIKTKKIKVENELKLKGIAVREFTRSVYNYTDYVVDDEKILQELKKDSESKARYFDENQCRDFFTIFTKINYLRGGESKSKFEKIGSIFITGNRFALHLAHHSKVKFAEDDIPFAKDIDYITNKFWFKLKKGFGNKSSLPKSFDVVTKAQIILSSQLNQSVSHEYAKLQKQVKEGSLTKDEALERSYELREKPNKPEDITFHNIDNSLEFLNNDSYFEDLGREKEKRDFVFQQTLKENEDLQKELRRRDEIEKQKQLAIAKEQEDIEKQSQFGTYWSQFKQEQLGNFFYFIYVFLLTMFPVFVGFLLKANKALNTWIESVGSYQYFIWGLLTIVFLAEVFGRSYLFNKDRIKLGWTWLGILLSSKKRSKIREEKYIEFERKEEAE